MHCTIDCSGFAAGLASALAAMRFTIWYSIQNKTISNKIRAIICKAFREPSSGIVTKSEIYTKLARNAETSIKLKTVILVTVNLGITQ